MSNASGSKFPAILDIILIVMLGMYLAVDVARTDDKIVVVRESAGCI